MAPINRGLSRQASSTSVTRSVDSKPSTASPAATAKAGLGRSTSLPTARLPRTARLKRSQSLPASAKLGVGTVKAEAEMETETETVAKTPSSTETMASGTFKGSPGKFEGSVTGPFPNGLKADLFDQYNTNTPGNGLSWGAHGTTKVSVGTGGVSGSFQHGVQGGLYGKTEGATEGSLYKASYSAQGKIQGDAHFGVEGGRPTVGFQGTAEGTFEAAAGTKPFKKEWSTSGSVGGQHGTASWNAQGSYEAGAKVGADGKLDLSGLTLNASGKASMETSASVGGKFTSHPLQWGGDSHTASVSGSVFSNAKLGAEVSGTAQLDAHNAFVEGKAGASAAAKLGTKWSVGAGPFSASGNLYGSAGLEATASGVAGYKDGVLKLGGSAGASAGLGFGGGFEVGLDTAKASQVLSHLSNNPFRVSPEAHQEMLKAHAGYYQNVASWVESDSHFGR